MKVFMVDQKRNKPRRAFIEWLRPLTRKEWKKRHGYDPNLGNFVPRLGIVRNRFQEVK